jgi:hypothetical protein
MDLILSPSLLPAEPFVELGVIRIRGVCQSASVLSSICRRHHCRRRRGEEDRNVKRSHDAKGGGGSGVATQGARIGDPRDADGHLRRRTGDAGERAGDRAGRDRVSRDPELDQAATGERSCKVGMKGLRG